MTTFEAFLISVIIYFVIGLVVNYFRPQDYYLGEEDLDYERFITTVVILLWPIEILRILTDNFDDNI